MHTPIRATRRSLLATLPPLALAFLLTACPAPAASPSPAPVETAEPTQTATPEPTESPTPEPTESGTSFGTPEEQLLASVPSGLRGTCEVRVGAYAFADSIATLECAPEEGADVLLYGLYDDLDAMHEVFFSLPADATIEDLQAGDCEDNPPSLSTYSNTDEEEDAGYISCFPAGEPYADYAELGWTDDGLLIRAEAQREDGDLAALYDWWASGAPGPIAPETGGGGNGGNGGGSDEVAFPTVEEEDLLSHIPQSFRDTCERPPFGLPPGDPGRDPDLLADVQCSPDDGPDEVGFTHYASAEAMDEAFDQAVEFFGLSEGACAQGELGVSTYTLEGAQVGRLLCAEQALGETGTVIHWTDERLNIKAYAASSETDIRSLYEWWRGDSGPVE